MSKIIINCAITVDGLTGEHVVSFDDLGDGRTQMTMVEYGYTTEDARNQSQAGLEQCVDKMAAIFASQN
jgi:hypothetical protein